MPGLPDDSPLPDSSSTTPASAFPAVVTLFAATYPKGVTVGPDRADGVGVDCPADLKLETNQEVRALLGESGNAIGSVTTYVVRLPGPGSATSGQLAAIEAVRSGDTVRTAASNWFPIMDLISIGPAVPVLADGTYRLRCEHTT